MEETENHSHIKFINEKNFKNHNDDWTTKSFPQQKNALTLLVPYQKLAMGALKVGYFLSTSAPVL